MSCKVERIDRLCFRNLCSTSLLLTTKNPHFYIIQGALIPDKELVQIAELLNRPEFRHIFIISDEIYDHIVYNDKTDTKNKFISFASLPNMVSL